MSTSRRGFLQTSALAAGLVASGHGARTAFGAPGDAARPLSPFLQGNFAPIHDEITVERLRVIGEIPADLDGMFVRNGPNPQFPPRGNYHWFDGDGMLHGVRIHESAASYRNRYVRTSGWQAEREAGHALWGGLSDPPDLKNILAGKAPFKNAANTALVWHDKRLLALWEAGEPHEIKVPDLETVGPYTFAGRLSHAFTAHPKVDAVTGEMLLFGYSPLSKIVRHSTVDAQGQLVRTVSVPMRRPVMMHDFAITEKYALFCDLPAVFDFAHAAKTGSMLRFDKGLGARFTIVPRQGDATPKSVDATGCFMFHTLNAYDDGDEVVLIGCRMEDYPEAVNLGATPTQSDNPLAATKAVLFRWRMNFATGLVKEEPLEDRGCEFPRLHERLVGRQSRYAYAMSLDMGAFVKFDLQTGTSVRHELGPGRLAGEGVFIPRPGGLSEDAGYLASYVYDRASETSELLIVAADDFTAPPLARLMIPARVPFGFHGLWLDQAALEA